MKLVIDTNVILDVLLKRQPFSESALKIFALVEKRELTGYVCGTTVTTIYYIVRKHLGAAAAFRCLDSILTLFDIAPVTRPVLQRALRLDFSDYEDAVLHEAAQAIEADGIITRNSADFRHAALPVFGPDELDAMMRGRSAF